MIPLVPVALLLFVASRRSKPMPRVIPILATCLVAHVCYVVWAGGDHLPAARFFVPLLGPWALLIAAALAAKNSGGRPWFQSAAAILGCIGALASPLLLSLPYHGGGEVGTIIGKYIDATWPKGSLVALNVAGATPYFAPEHRFLDMLGLNDPAIARRHPVLRCTEWQNRPGHAKGDGAYVLARRPDFIIIGPAMGAAAEEGLFLGEVELSESAEFHDCYRREEFSFPTDDPWVEASAIRWDSVDFIYFRFRRSS